jgi:hypothetical protein
MLKESYGSFWMPDLDVQGWLIVVAICTLVYFFGVQPLILKWLENRIHERYARLQRNRDNDMVALRSKALSVQRNYEKEVAVLSNELQLLNGGRFEVRPIDLDLYGRPH